MGAVLNSYAENGIITGSGIKPHSGIARIRQISVRQRTPIFLIAGYKKNRE